MSNYRKKSYKKQQKEKQKRMMIPLMMVPFISLLVRMYQYDTKLGDQTWFAGEEYVDVFLHCKMVAVVFIAAIMVGILVYRNFNKHKGIFGDFKKQDWIQWAPLGLFFMLSLVSTIFSKYSYWGWHGGFDQFESVLAILSYGVIALYAYIFVQNEEQLQRCMIALLISAGIVGLIGTFQALGQDLFRTEFGQKLICGGANVGIQYNVGEDRTYATLFNPNYVGVYACLVIPVLFSFMMVVRKLWMKVMTGATMLLVLFAMYGSSSKAGFLVICCLALCMLILYRKNIMKHKTISIGIIGGMIFIAGVLIAIRGNSLIQSVKNAVTITKSEPRKLTNIVTDESGVHVTYDGHELTFCYDMSQEDISTQLKVSDEEGNLIVCNYSETNFSISDERFSNIHGSLAFSDVGYDILTVYIDDAMFSFVKDGERYCYFNSYGKLISLDGVEIPRAKLLDGYERMISGRGYIWSRTLPLLKHYILFGAGADSFMFVFPQNDYIGRTYNGYANQVMTKPHNIYLQVATQDGLLAMMGMLVGWILYLVSTIRNIWKEDINTVEKHLMVGICVSVFGYVIMGLTNDSSITVAPVFWLLLGCGMALNRMIEKQNVDGE